MDSRIATIAYKPYASFKTNRKSRSKNNRGALMLLIPLVSWDIIIEIFAYLLPIDIIRLSRSSNLFRMFLFSRRNAFVWRQARINASWFPCPCELSEVEYAIFRSFHICMTPGCGASVSSDGPLNVVHIPKLSRWCEPCMYNNVVLLNDIPLRYNIPIKLAKKIPYIYAERTTISVRGREKLCYKPTVEAIVSGRAGCASGNLCEFDLQLGKELSAEKKRSWRVFRDYETWNKATEKQWEGFYKQRHDHFVDDILKHEDNRKNKWTANDMPTNDNERWAAIIRRPYSYDQPEFKDVYPQLVLIITDHIRTIRAGSTNAANQ